MELCLGSLVWLELLFWANCLPLEMYSGLVHMFQDPLHSPSERVECMRKWLRQCRLTVWEVYVFVCLCLYL